MCVCASGASCRESCGVAKKVRQLRAEIQNALEERAARIPAPSLPLATASNVERHASPIHTRRPAPPQTHDCQLALCRIATAFTRVAVPSCRPSFLHHGAVRLFKPAEEVQVSTPPRECLGACILIYSRLVFLGEQSGMYTTMHFA